MTTISFLVQWCNLEQFVPFDGKLKGLFTVDWNAIRIDLLDWLSMLWLPDKFHWWLVNLPSCVGISQFNHHSDTLPMNILSPFGIFCVSNNATKYIMYRNFDIWNWKKDLNWRNEHSLRVIRLNTFNRTNNHFVDHNFWF